MKALWIRVEAHEVDSVRIGCFAEQLGVDVVTAFGHYVALGGSVAEHTDDGNIAGVSDLMLARWGRWSGKVDRFASAVRGVFQSDEGEYANWLAEMGELVKRRARDRNRKPKVGGTSMDFPGNFHGIPTENRRDSRATERNGTERSTDLEKESSNRRSGISDESPISAAAPPADASFADTGKRFLSTFYRGASAKRLADVRRQIFATLEPTGAKLKGQCVRAGSEQRLVAKMREVLAEGVNDNDKAIVVLLLKLGDTSDGSAPGVAAAAAEQREAKRDEGETARELVDAYAWLDMQEGEETNIDLQLEAEGFRDAPADDPSSIAWKVAKNARVLEAWRRDRPPDARPHAAGST